MFAHSWLERLFFKWCIAEECQLLLKSHRITVYSLNPTSPSHKKRFRIITKYTKYISLCTIKRIMWSVGIVVPFFPLLLSFHMVRDLISHGCIWLFPHSLPRLLLSDGKPVLDLQLCTYNEGKGDRREDFTSTVWRLGWDKTKGKAFLGSQIADSGRWDLPCTQPSINYALTGTLIPKVHFLLKGRGLDFQLVTVYLLYLLACPASPFRIEGSHMDTPLKSPVSRGFTWCV